MTQKEFAKRLPNNPKTGKPYNDRTIRKWLGGERSTKQIQKQVTPGRGKVYVQVFRAPDGSTKSFRMRLPRNTTMLDMLLSDDGRKARSDALKAWYYTQYESDGEPSDDFDLEDAVVLPGHGRKHVIDIRYSAA